VIAALEAGAGKLTPARRRWLAAYVRQVGLWEASRAEADVLDELRRAASVVDAGISDFYARRGLAPPRQGAFNLPEARVSPIERLHAEQAGNAIALWVEERGGASDFRREHFGGKKLSVDSAQLFLSSFAARTLSLDRVRDEGLELGGRRSTEFTPSPRHYFLPSLERPDFLILRLGIRIWEPGDGGASTDFVLEVPAWPASLPPWKKAAWRRSGDVPREIKYLPGSTFERLWELADHIAWSTLWSQADCAWYVLTGESPPPPRVEVRLNHHEAQGLWPARIEMAVPPWVSHETVAKAYRQARVLLFGSRPRSLSKHSLERFGFVLERCKDLSPSRDLLSRCAEDWGRSSGLRGRCLAARLHNFARDFERTREAIVEPTYAMEESRTAVIARRQLLRQLRRKAEAHEKVALRNATKGTRAKAGRSQGPAARKTNRKELRAGPH
jgi:hypothetical protein